MNVKPSVTFDTVIDEGTTGLAGTITLEANNNEGVTSIAASALDITEIAYGVYAATGRVSPDTEGQYTLIWKDGAGGVLGINSLVVTSSAPADPPTGDSYTTVNELFRVLGIRAPTAAQEAAALSKVLAAALEIDREIDRVTALDAREQAIAAEVNLERAVQLWTQEESPSGVIGLGEPMPIMQATNTWERFAYILAPLKETWGLS